MLSFLSERLRLMSDSLFGVLPEWLGERVPLDTPNVTLFAVEATLDVVALVGALLMIGVLLPTVSCLHRNLKVTIYNTAACIALITSTRLLLIANRFLDFFPQSTADFRWLAFAHDVGMSMDDSAQWTLVAERLVATLRAAEYERSENHRFTAFVAVFPWLCALVQAAPSHVLFPIFMINKAKLRRGFGTLSERYQVVENMRSMSTLNVLIIGGALRNMIKISLNICYNHMKMTNNMPAFLNHIPPPERVNYFSALYSHAIDITIAVFAIVILALIVHSLPEMRRVLWCIDSQHKRNVVSVAACAVMERANVQQDHFVHLSNAWSDAFAKKGMPESRSNSVIVNSLVKK